jgi:hypothetical protein
MTGVTIITNILYTVCITWNLKCLASHMTGVTQVKCITDINQRHPCNIHGSHHLHHSRGRRHSHQSHHITSNNNVCTWCVLLTLFSSPISFVPLASHFPLTFQMSLTSCYRLKSHILCVSLIPYSVTHKTKHIHITCIICVTHTHSSITLHSHLQH